MAMLGNLFATLLRIRTFGKIKLEKIKDLISVADYKMCESKWINILLGIPLSWMSLSNVYIK